MHMLTKEIANEIVKETSIRLHRNVNIMNTEGIIIATQDKSRIGSIHNGAIEVLKSGKTLTIHEDENNNWEGSQPGVNLPIVFLEQIIGVIGITGDPDEMGSVGELVKMTTELMIRQEFMDLQMEWKQRTKETIIEQLLKSDASVTSIDQSLSLLGLHLRPPFTTTVIQITKRSVPNRTLVQKIEEIIGLKNGIVSFVNVNRIFITIFGIEEKESVEMIEDIYTLLKKQNVISRMAYSLPFSTLDTFSQSYKDCDITLKTSDPDSDIVSFAQIEAKALIYQVDERLAERFSHRVLNGFDENKARTLEAFFVNDLNIQKTANDLYVHRNTLIYRLNKIIEDTGYDPRKFKDALILQVALWLFQKAEKNDS
ncbi:Transcriptional regulator [Sporosarcina sp. ANT_H38]